MSETATQSRGCGCGRRRSADTRTIVPPLTPPDAPKIEPPKPKPFSPITPKLKFSSGEQPAHLANLFRGRSAFLIAGGPSFAKIDKALLDSAGLLVVGINNSVKSYRPDIWVHGDNVDHFMRSIFFDPAIMKFTPAGQKFTHVFDSDAWAFTDCRLKDCPPNQYFYDLSTGVKPSTWLQSDRVFWGDKHDCRSTFFAALRILYEIGIRTVYLLGVDLDMDQQQPYHFDEKKHTGGVASNNSIYQKIIKRCELLKPYFDAAGFKVFNCNPDSKLKVFPFMPFERAVKQSLDEFGVADLQNERTNGLYNDKKPSSPNQIARNNPPKLVPAAKWGIPLPLDHSKVYSHMGKIGDVIYALPAIRALGGGELHLVTGGKLSPETAMQMKPLLEKQPYISKVTISDKVEGNDIWTRWKEQATKHNKTHNIAEQHLVSLALPRNGSDWKWLKVDEPIATYDVIIHRSPRYHNDRFPWAAVLTKYAGRIGMVGSKREHEMFVRKFGDVPYVETPDFTTLARTIAGAKLFIGNQSGPYAIAEALKMLTVQETYRPWPNCVWNRANAVYGHDGKVKLPDVPRAAIPQRHLTVVGRLHPTHPKAGDQRAFLSALPHGDGYFGVIRDWTHKGVSTIWKMRFDKDGNVMSEWKLSCNGEDPRIFRHGGKLMCSYVEPNGKDWDTYIHDLATDTRVKLQCDGYKGKNWMPVMDAPDGAIWVVRSLEPLVVLKVDPSTGATTPLFKLDGEIGARRGGSAAVYRDGKITGYSHRTVNYSDHHVVGFEIDCGTWAVTFDEPIMPSELNKGVNDPTALFDDGRVMVCHSERNWFSPQNYDHLICEVK